MKQKMKHSLFICMKITRSGEYLISFLWLVDFKVSHLTCLNWPRLNSTTGEMTSRQIPMTQWKGKRQSPGHGCMRLTVQDVAARIYAVMPVPLREVLDRTVPNLNSNTLSSMVVAAWRQ